MLEFSFSCKLGWGSYTISIAKFISKKSGALIHSIKFLSTGAALHLYKSTIQPCMEYCCHILVGARSYYVELLKRFL